MELTSWRLEDTPQASCSTAGSYDGNGSAHLAVRIAVRAQGSNLLGGRPPTAPRHCVKKPSLSSCNYRRREELVLMTYLSSDMRQAFFQRSHFVGALKATMNRLRHLRIELHRVSIPSLVRVPFRPSEAKPNLGIPLDCLATNVPSDLAHSCPGSVAWIVIQDFRIAPS